MKSKVSARPEAPKTLDSLLDQLPKAPFGRSDVTVGYLRLIRSTFADQTDQEGLPHTLAELDLEFVVPREQSINTAVVCRCCLAKPVYWLGLKSAHCRCRRSTKAMRRSWLLPLGAWGATSRRWLGQFLAAQLGSRRITPLGAAYFPSAGITPERVHPFVVAIEAGAADLPYAFVRLEDLKARIFSLRDGHLPIATCRLIHALGRW